MASAAVKELNDSTFEAATASGVSLVDFWAPWCGPCRMQGPIVDELASEIGDKATIAKVNVDDSPSIAAKFGIRSIPTIYIMKDGQVAEQFVGVQTKENLQKAINKQLA